MRNQGLIFFLLAAGCTEAICGDGVCTGDETAGCCPSDCPCVTDPDDCNFGQICVGDHCEFSLPRSYLFTNVQVSVPPLNKGVLWDQYDPPLEYPDLYVADETGLKPFTSIAPNTLDAAFPPFTARLTGAPGAGDIGVWDDDAPAASDGAFVCRYPAEGFDPRPRTFSCGGALGSFSATIEPL